MNDRQLAMTPERKQRINANRKTVKKWVSAEQVLEEFKAALGGYMPVTEYLQQLLIAFERDDIAECTPESQYKTMRDLAAMVFIPTLNHVALIPRNLKGQGLCCTWMPQWQGMHALMLRSPHVKDVRAVLVHKLDQIEIDGTTDTVVSHQKDPFNPKRVFRSLSDLQGGYLHLQFYDRHDRFHFVPVEIVKKAMGCAQTQKMWNAWFEEMCLKTIYRNAYARRVVPMDPVCMARMETVLQQEDRLHGNDPGRLVQSASQTKRRAPVSLDEMFEEQQSQPAIEHSRGEVEIPQEVQRVDRGEPVEAAAAEPRRKSAAPQASQSEPSEPGAPDWEAIETLIAQAKTPKSLEAVYKSIREQLPEPEHMHLDQLIADRRRAIDAQ